ncbi:recombinase family protein [Bacillus mobilis]|uniref:recombinase family protein n=1 Tax=Bacillus mobilis TaxID=2026190 RepID=UPI003D64B40A
MKIGYARVSTEQQELGRQLDALNNYGVDRIIEEKFTGTTRDRAGLNNLLDIIRKDDTVVVESISRIGRNTLDILHVIQEFEQMGVTFVSLKENMDTTTATGKAMFQMMVVLAELERNLTVERVKEGLAAAKNRGKKLGRPSIDNDKVINAMRLYDSGEWSIKDIISTTGISQGSLYRAINKRKAEQLLDNN